MQGGTPAGGAIGAIFCWQHGVILSLAVPPYCVLFVCYCAVQDSKHFTLIIEMPNSNPPRYLHTAIAIASIAVGACMMPPIVLAA